jgi:hypothetical protein
LHRHSTLHCLLMMRLGRIGLRYLHTCSNAANWLHEGHL